MRPKEIRRQSGRSRAWVAAQANVSEPTAKLYEEAGPEAVASDTKRAALANVYARLLAPNAGAAPHAA
jgi:hypothetical protein